MEVPGPAVLERARELQRAADSRANRRPKQLSQAPSLLSAQGGTGLAVSPRGGGHEDDPGRRTATMFSAEDGERDDEPDADGPARESVHRVARQIAAQLRLHPPRMRRPRSRSSGELRSAPYRGESDDVDLDRTLELLAERRPLHAEEIVVSERRTTRRAIVLLVDVSGSMRGRRLQTPAAAVGALTAELSHDLLSVIAFASDAALLVRLRERATLEQVIDALLALDPAGLTNVCFPLEVAEAELSRVTGYERRVILLSDCVHNAGPDPRTVATRLPRLDVLFDTSAECDIELARGLGAAGRGEVVPIRDHHDVAPALSRIFDG